MELAVEESVEGGLGRDRAKRVVAIGEAAEDDVRPAIQPRKDPAGQEFIVDRLVPREGQHESSLRIAQAIQGLFELQRVRIRSVPMP